MAIRLFCLGLFLLLTGCGNTGAGSSGPASYHYSNEWWYDDYLYYWHHYHPNCCQGDGEYKEVMTQWWQSLDPDKQQEIKNKFDNWQGDRADIADNLPAVKARFDQKWQSLPPATQQRVRQQLQNRRAQGPVDRSAIQHHRPAFQRGMMNHPNIGAGHLRGLGGGGLRGGM